MNLKDLTVVTQTARLGSISEAARHLDMQVATASAAIKRVERDIGFDLFVRSTRKLMLSKQGEQYIPHCEQALLLLATAKSDVDQKDATLKGSIKITTSSDLGRNFLSQSLEQVLDAHPDIDLNLVLSDHNIDFYRDNVDMAVRYGSVSDSSMVAFKLADVPRLLLASPAYLKSHDHILSPDDLLQHEGLFYRISGLSYNTWTFSKASESFRVSMKGRRIANDGEMVRRWCAQGHGLAVKSALDVGEDLLNRRLVEVLPDYSLSSSELYLLCPNRSVVSPLVRRVRDHLRSAIKARLAQIATVSNT